VQKFTLRRRCSSIVGIAAVAWFFAPTAAVIAQNNGNGDNAAGIYINAQGVVESVLGAKHSESLDKKRIAEAAGKLPANVMSHSDLRKVSLAKLEAAFAPYAGKSGSIPKDLFYLAGLQRIDYVFIYPDTNDVVIAGPAEGFAPNSIGRTVGVTTGRAPLRIDDLILAFRSATQGHRVRCSIDPVPENLAAMQRHIAAHRDSVFPAEAHARYQEWARILGMADISVDGVPADSHFAQTLVEADYRMKLISMALEPSGVKGLGSHLSMLRPQGNTMQRWWLTPLYDAIATTDDRLAYELVGQRVQMMAQEEIADAGGNRRDAASTRRSTQKWAQQFTEKFPELADASPVFGELQSLFDLLVVGALIQKEDLFEKSGWHAETFLHEPKIEYPRSNVPRKVASVANSRRATRGMALGLVGGGVVIDARQVLNSTDFQVKPERRLDGRRTSAGEEVGADAQRWWWD
jgi:hypothetical protein